MQHVAGLPAHQQVQALKPPMPLSFSPTAAPLQLQPEEERTENEPPQDTGAAEEGASAPPAEPPPPDDSGEPGDGAEGSDDGGSAGDADPDDDEEPVQAQSNGATAEPPFDSLQMSDGGSSAAIKQSAANGIAGSGGSLPHADRIQQSFGSHDISGIRAHVGGAAATANAEMGSLAYATGSDVAFRSAPDLHTAAHEAAHVVQQGQGVSLKDGIGQVGDKYERHADAVADRVVRGQSAEDLLTAGPDVGASGGAVQHRSHASADSTVQKADDDAPAAPSRVKLSLAGQPFRVRLPKNPKQTVTVNLRGKKVAGVKLATAKLKFNPDWKITGGSVEAAAQFKLDKLAIPAEFKLGIGAGGVIESAVSGAKIESGPVTGTCDLEMGRRLKGSADLAVKADVPLKLSRKGRLVLGAGSAGKVTLAKGKLQRFEVSKLVGTIRDKKGALVGVEGKATYTPKSFSASGQATLKRSLSKKMGRFTVALLQGDSQGAVEVDGSQIVKLDATFKVVVTDKKGEVGSGRFTGSYQQGPKIIGSGRFNLTAPLEIGPEPLRAVVAQGLEVGLQADAGKAKVTLDGLKVTVRTPSQVVADGTASSVSYDGAALEGDVSLSLSQNLDLAIDPLTISVASSGKLGLSYQKGKLVLSGSQLGLSMAYEGAALGGVSFPEWSLKMASPPSLHGAPRFELPPALDPSRLLTWLSSFFSAVGGAGLPTWLVGLWERLQTSFNFDFGGALTGFMDWLKSFQLPLPSPIPLPEFGGKGLDLSGMLKGWSQKLLGLVGNYDLNIPLPDLTTLFANLGVPGFVGDWLNTYVLGENGLNLGLTSNGSVNLKGQGAKAPGLAGENLNGGLTSNGQPVGNVLIPNLSYDGKVLKATLNLTFAPDFGPKLGKKKLMFAAGGENIQLQWTPPTGKFQIKVPTLSVSLVEGGVTRAGGALENAIFDQSGLVCADGAITLGTKKGFVLSAGGAAGFALDVKPRSEITVRISSSHSLKGIAARNLGVAVLKGGAVLGSARFKHLNIDETGFTCDGRMTVTGQEFGLVDRLVGYDIKIVADLSKPLSVVFDKSQLKGIGGTFKVALGNAKGPIGDGTFRGNLANIGEADGPTITGRGTVNTQQPMKIGLTRLHALIGAGLRLNVRADAAGAISVALRGLDLSLRTGERTIAQVKSKSAKITPEGVMGDFAVTLDPSLRAKFGPLTIIVESKGPISLAFDPLGTLAVGGSGLAVQLLWDGQFLGRLVWPNWLLKLAQAMGSFWDLVKEWLGQLFGAVKFPQVDLNMAKILAWLRGLLPSKWPDWLVKLWNNLLDLLKNAGAALGNMLSTLAGLIPSLGGGGMLSKLLDMLLELLGKLMPNLSVDKLLDWLRSLVPNLGGGGWLNKLWQKLLQLGRVIGDFLKGVAAWLASKLPSFKGGGFLSKLWGAILRILRGIPRIGPLSFRWLRRLLDAVLAWLDKFKFGAPSLELAVDQQGDFDFAMTEPLPSVWGRNMSATLKSNKKLVARLRAQEIAFDGKTNTFTAAFSARFGPDFHIKVGEKRKLRFARGADIKIQWVIGETLSVSVPVLGATLYDETDQAIAQGSITGGLLGEQGVGGRLDVKSLKPTTLAKAKDGSWQLDAPKYGVSATLVAGKGLANARVTGSGRFIRRGQQMATGTVNIGFDGEDVDGDFGLTVPKGVSVRGDKPTGWNVESQGAGIKGHIASSELSSITLNGKAKVTKGQEPYLNVSFNNVGYTVNEGISGTIGASLAADRTVGDPKGWHAILSAKGAKLWAKLEKNKLAEVGGTLQATVCDAQGPLIKGGIKNATYFVEDNTFSGTGTLALLRPLSFPKGAAKNPPPGIWATLKSGQVSATIEKNKLTQFSIKKLSGELRRGDELLAGMSGGATYDFEKGEVTKANVFVWMDPKKTIQIMNGVTLSGVFGKLKLAPDFMKVSAGGMISVRLGKDKFFKGVVKVCWTQQGEKDDFKGSKAAISGVLIDNKAKGRYLGGTFGVEIGAGNVPLINAEKVRFSLNHDVGGTISLKTKKKGDDIEPIVYGGSLSFKKTLLGKKTLFDFSLGKAKGAKGSRGRADFSLLGGAKLVSKALTAKTSFGLQNEWRPAEGEIPDIDAKIKLSWGLRLDGELLAKLGLGVNVFYGIKLLIDVMGGIGGSVDVPFEPTLHIWKDEKGELQVSLDFNLAIEPQIAAILRLAIGLGIPILGVKLMIDGPEFGFDLGTLFRVELSTNPEEDQETKPANLPKASPSAQPEVKEHGDTAVRPGQQGGALGGLQSGSGHKGESGGLDKLMKQAQLVSDAALGLQGLGCLVSKIISGISAFLVGGPIGFAAWALYELVTGGISEIVGAIRLLQCGMSALNDLLGDLTKEPDMKWLGDALNLLDTKADDNARKKVKYGEHKDAPLATQASLIKAMYAGFTGDDDEGAIIQIMRDTDDLKALLIAASGDVKAGVDQALDELQGYEDRVVRQLFRDRGLTRYLKIADDIYARECVTDLTYREMSTTQRAMLIKMLESGSCRGPDEVAIIAILRFSKEAGDLGGVLCTAFGDLKKAKLKLNHSLDGTTNDQFWRMMPTLGVFPKPSVRWEIQIGNLPDALRRGADERLDEFEKLYEPHATWDHALRLLVRGTDYENPLDGDLAKLSWPVLSDAYGRSLNRADKQALRKAIYGGDLRHLKRQLAVALLKGSKTPLANAGDEMRRYLAKLRKSGKLE